MGVGTKGYQNIMEQQYQQSVITSAVLSFKNAHYHNQYLDSYVLWCAWLINSFRYFYVTLFTVWVAMYPTGFFVFQLVVCALLQD